MTSTVAAGAVAGVAFLAGIGWSLVAVAGRADARARAMMRDQWEAEARRDDETAS